MTEQRLIEMETKFLYQEDTIEQLNQVICKQQEQIQNLQKSFDLIAKNLKFLLENSEEIRGHEKPPHY
ncbi:MAG: SlyX family protein [Bdellovibrionaceae bacterium]|nr:SlyX family protein [Pseudobdellovibrionaceae bacterium]